MADRSSAGLTTRRLAATDADALKRCFERCYGGSYGHDEFYEPERIAARVRDGSLRSVVTVLGDGEIIGHTGLSLGDPAARVIEAGNTVVDPAHRGTGVLRELGIALVDLCRADGLAGFVHYPTTAHEVMQKTAERFGGVETGVMLAYVPAETDYREVEVAQPEGRLAATVVYQPLGEIGPRGVAYPDRHHELLERLYAEIGVERPALDPRALAGPTRAHAESNPRQGVVRVTVNAPGADLRELLEQLAPADSTTATLVDLPLSDPGTGAAVEALAALGFFYCALLPEFAPGDVLRLQRVEGEPPTAFAPALANEPARRLLRYINADRPG